MIPGVLPLAELRVRIPRESGDDPTALDKYQGRGEYSPRERG